MWSGDAETKILEQIDMRNFFRDDEEFAAVADAYDALVDDAVVDDVSEDEEQWIRRITNMSKFEELKRQVENGEDPAIALKLEDDSCLYCGIKAIFQMDGNDYIAFFPLQEGSPEIIFFRIKRTEEDDVIFEDIETHKEYFKVAATYELLFEQEQKDKHWKDGENRENLWMHCP